MKTIDAVKNRIYELCKVKNITINKLAALSGISRSSLKNILYGKSNNPGIMTIKILCDGLDISLFDFFNSDTFKNLEQELD